MVQQIAGTKFWPIQPLIKGFDWLAFLIVMGICLLGATNGGSTGLMLAFLWIVYEESDLARRWWQAMRYLFLSAVLFMLLLCVNSFNYAQALHDAWGGARGILMSLLALYLLHLPGAVINRVMLAAVIAVSVLAVLVLGWNIHLYGLVETLQRQGLDTFVHRNRLGEGLATAWVVGLALLLFSGKSILRQPLLLVLLLWLLLISYVNHSRGALMGQAAAAMALALVWSWRKALLAGAGGLLLLLVAKSMGMLDKIITHNSGSGSIGNGREFLWPPIWVRVEENPWYGYGLHAINNDPVLLRGHIEDVPHVHSIYLDMLYASGIVGVLFWFVWVVFFVTRMKFGMIRQNQAAPYMGWGILAYTLVHGLVDFSFYSLGTLSLLAFSGALAIALAVKGLNNENSAHS